MATISAKPGPPATASSSVVVLNFVAPIAIWRYTASGEPSERKSSATGEPLRRLAASSPTARANWGCFATRAPAAHSAIASSKDTQLPMSVRYSTERALPASRSSSATAPAPP